MSNLRPSEAEWLRRFLAGLDALLPPLGPPARRGGFSPRAARRQRLIAEATAWAIAGYEARADTTPENAAQRFMDEYTRDWPRQ